MQPGMDSLNAKLNLLFYLRSTMLRKVSGELDLHPGQAPILNFIWKHPGCTQKEVADAMMISPASVAVSTKRMQKAGLLEKQTDEHNLRCNFLQLTPKGLEAVESVEQELRAFEQRTQNGIPESDKEAAERFLDTMIRNIIEHEHILPQPMFCRKDGEADA